MALGKRLYWVVALVAVLALAGAGITLTSRLTSAGGSSPGQTCAEENEADDATDGGADDANENDAADTSADDANENEASDAGADDANEHGAQCGNEAVQPAGTLDDGKDLLPQAKISIDQAIAAAQTTGTGAVGEVDLEDYNGRLVFNVDIGDKDVKVDAADGTVLTADTTD